MPTKTIPVTAGEDVASLGTDNDHWYFIVDPADCDIGWAHATTSRQGNALRFLDVPIPPGSTILYAYLRYNAFGNYVGDSVYAYIKAEKSLNPQPFTTWANYIARPRTTAFSDWAEIRHWFLNTWYNSVDITSVIQEVIDQGGWEQGNPIAVFCWDEDDRSTHENFCMRHGKAYHIHPDLAPQLHLSWLSPTDDPLPPALGESYTIGGDTLFKCDSPNYSGQTFTPQTTHILHYIDLQMRGPLREPTPVILVFNAGADHKPFGNYISRNRVITEQHCSYFTTGRVRFSMTPVKLYKGYKYVIIVQNYPPLLGASAYWQYDKGDAHYPGGKRISTNDKGDTWTVHYDDDHLFAEFGTPPLPKPEPPPPITNFAALNIYFIHAPDYIMIFLHTATPCHLTLYHTDKKPLKHHLARTIRGLEVPWGVYFCFVAWTAYEQLEAGDTLWHTFVIAPWEYCQTKWFTFRGEVDDILSPSVGPIFMHHHSGPEPFCNLGFEDYPYASGVPPCWKGEHIGIGTGRWLRDTVNVREGLYSCQTIADGLDSTTYIKQEKWTTPWLGKTIKFRFWWYGGGRGGISIGGKSTGFNYTTRWHTWSATITFGLNPHLITMYMSAGGRGSSYTALSWDDITIEEV